MPGDDTASVIPMGALSDLLAQLDPDPYRRGKQFEHICKWFLTNDPVYKHELRRLWLWDEWPGRWGIDAGVDLVAEDRNGRLWAIQAKAYGPTYRVTKRDVNKFLAESGREVFSYRMLIATTNLIDRIGERTIQDQEKRVTFFRLNDLQAAAVDWPRSPEDLRPARLRKPARPRKHQRKAITKVLTGFASAERGQLIMACGTGKTLTALFINDELDAARTLVLVPSLSLLKQTLNVWRANCTSEFASLPVCSDDTVANNDDDVALAHISDLGVPVTTDPEQIAVFLRQRSSPRVVFATYQSSPEIAKAFALGRVPGFDLVIADEAHRCAGPASSDFATVLDPDKIKAKRRLFMTATPRYFTGRVLKAAEEAEFEYASMDEEAKFGKVFHRLSFGEAIKHDLLTDYQVAIVGVDDATYLKWARDGVLVTRDGVKVTDARTLAGQIGLAKAMGKYELHRVISFHSRVKRARDFAASMPEVLAWMPASLRPQGELWSRHASGEMPAGDRFVLLQHLGCLDDDDRGLLANARCLAEGVDVPTLDGIAFVDPRRSEVDIVQAVGRAIRKSEDKTVGTIVIPVFIKTDEDPEVALNNSAFTPVWEVINALRAHDDELGEQLDALRRQIGRQGRLARLPDKIQVDLPVGIGVDFAQAFDVRLVEQTTVSWEFWFGLVERFVESHGHARVPQSYKVDGYRLGFWVTTQRGRRARGTLGEDRERRLRDLPGWTWDPKADKWEEGFSRLLAYVEQNGHARVPRGYKVDDYPLGVWVVMQRHRRTTLDDDRQRRLLALPGWTWDPFADAWEEGFSRVLAYVEQNGHARVPRSYKVDDYPLGAWVSQQRVDHNRGTLDKDREDRLQQVPGWTWDPFADAWDEGFSRVLAYVEQNGHARVPHGFTFNGYPLGAWVKQQRADRAEGRLRDDRERLLKELPGWAWDAQAAKWEDGVSRLLAYVEQNGHARVPRGYKVDDYPLGVWVVMQRHRRTTLDDDRQRRLLALPGWTWDPFADAWEEGFSRVLAYVEQNGHARVPRSYKVDDYPLGAWVSQQRVDHNRGTLDKDREDRLQQVPGWTWDPFADAWDEGFSRVLAYVEQNGHARVPHGFTFNGYPLGAWVKQQRADRAEGRLRDDRERLLKELPGWAWDAQAAKWEDGVSRLLAYVEQNGHARVPVAYNTADGYRLGWWVRKQRVNYNNGILDEDRQRRLKDLPGWTWKATSSTSLAPGLPDASSAIS